MKWKTLFLVFVASVDGLDRKTTFAQESSVKEVDSKSLSCQRYKLNIYRRNILSYYGFKPKLNTTGNWFIEHFKVNICKEEIYWTFLCHYKGIFFFATSCKAWKLVYMLNLFWRMLNLLPVATCQTLEEYFQLCSHTFGEVLGEYSFHLEILWPIFRSMLRIFWPQYLTFIVNALIGNVFLVILMLTLFCSYCKFLQYSFSSHR